MKVKLKVLHRARVRLKKVTGLSLVADVAAMVGLDLVANVLKVVALVALVLLALLELFLAALARAMKKIIKVVVKFAVQYSLVGLAPLVVVSFLLSQSDSAIRNEFPLKGCKYINTF